MAAQEARQQIAETPDDAHAHAILALCLKRLKQHREALESAARAVHMAPDDPFAHYVLGHVYMALHRYKDAETAANTAIGLAPEADYFALRASVRADGHRWKEALNDAQAGLSVDPDHVGCANLRALCLVKLGRRDDAGMVLESALAKDPENDVTHANRGWALLHEGRHREAMEHFREALRLNPNQEWARDGIVEALKARNPLYRLLLRYFLWMSRLSRRAQWGVMLGAVAVARTADTFAHTSTPAAPYLSQAIWIYIGFVYLTWTAKPLSNLLLRIDRFGRYALTRDQIVASNWMGALLALAAICAIVNIPLGRLSLMLAWIACVVLTIPVSGTFATRHPGRRRILAIYTIVLAALATAIVPICAFDSVDLALNLAMVFLVGSVAFTWVASILRSKR
jgi:tetratricopeptide (TPR) repeat protein